MKTVITTEGLTKQYGKKKVVDHVDLQVPRESIYGFLGPNGAGKSTTMKMILGLAKPTVGKIRVMGREMIEKNRIGILKETGSLIESPSYYGHLTGRENLQIIASLKNVPEKEINRTLGVVHLEKQQHKKVKQYSFGMKQRLGLAAALLGSPKLLLLDEPTNGLDPAGIQEIRDLIVSFPKEYGMTILVSSHMLSEIDQMATHVGIIDKGELIFQDSLPVLHEHSCPQILLQTNHNLEAFSVLRAAGCPVLLRENAIALQKREDEAVMDAVSRLVRAGIGVLRVQEKQRSLEEIFLSLTGREGSL